MKKNKKKKKEKYSKIDIFNLCLGIVNFLGLIVSVIIAFLAIKSNEEIAEKSGAFDKGKLEMLFGGNTLEENSINSVYFGINLDQSEIISTSLPIKLNNIGQKSLENVNAIFKYSSFYEIAIKDYDYNHLKPFSDSVVRKYIKKNPYENIAYSFISLNPNQSINIDEFFLYKKDVFRPIKSTYLSKTQDKTYELDLYNLCKINFEISSKDTKTCRYDFLIFTIEENNFNNFFDKLINIKRNEISFISKTDKKFYVVLPKVGSYNSYPVSKTETYSDETTTFTCEFDDDYKNLNVYNSEGTFKKMFKL